MSKEKARDTNVKVSGIGVVICDSMDNLIYEVKKPIGIDGNDVLNDDNVELEAIVEGLHNALSFELPRVTYFCHDQFLH